MDGREFIVTNENGSLFINSVFLKDHEAKYFFAFILQPLDWRLPVFVIHLSRSMTGHQTLNDIKDIKDILEIINAHSHFSVHFFAADGETSLSLLHQQAFDKYSSLIPQVLEGKINLDDFVKQAYVLCKIIPILDMLHGVKSGRNKLIPYIIKLGTDCDLISADDLAEDLLLHINVFNDKSTTGRMKNHYAITLFTVKHALIEFEKGKNSSGFYLFIYALILELFRKTYNSLKLRKTICDFCLFIMMLLIKKSNKLPSETSFRKSDDSKFVWFNSKIGIIKFLNTLIAVSYCLNDPKNQFALRTGKVVFQTL